MMASRYPDTVIPDHVDPRLVVDFDYLDPPGLAAHGDIYRCWHALHDGPDIVWTPRHGGHWILTRGEDIRWAQESHEIFSREELSVPRGSCPYLPPATLNPPESIRYRAVLNPGFTRRRVHDSYEPRTRALTIDLIETLHPRGECDFVAEFARVMPVCVFLGIVDLPAGRREEFLAWGTGLARQATRPAFQQKIAAYLAEVLEDRRRHPVTDLLSDIAAWWDNPRFKDDSEPIGMAMLVFAGGLDTIAAVLSFTMWHLAGHPELQRRLRDDPALIPAAVEEFLRRYAVSSTARIVTRPCERKGARFMPGDMVMVPMASSGIDDRLCARPLVIDFDRGPVSHNTFGSGPHRCVGEHLARMEIAVFLEEWTKRMPIVRLDPRVPPLSHPGSVEGVTRLNLLWAASPDKGGAWRPNIQRTFNGRGEDRYDRTS